MRPVDQAIGLGGVGNNWIGWSSLAGYPQTALQTLGDHYAEPSFTKPTSEAVQETLLSLHRGGGADHASTKGREREHFIHKFLEQVLPPLHRFGSGDITDSLGQRSGQVDIVLQTPPSSKPAADWW